LAPAVEGVVHLNRKLIFALGAACYNPNVDFFGQSQLGDYAVAFSIRRWRPPCRFAITRFAFALTLPSLQAVGTPLDLGTVYYFVSSESSRSLCAATFEPRALAFPYHSRALAMSAFKP
jgi:hypothetical protein